MNNEKTLPLRQLFGFHSEPFRADPHKAWLDEPRRESVEQFTALIERGGFGVLTGPVGCGKTILLGHLCSQLSENTHRVIYVACAECGPPDLLRLICSGLNLEPSLGKSRMTARIHQRVREMKGITPVLVTDEAQSLPQQTLDTLRVTCSGGLEGHNPFAVILAGTEEFLNRLDLRVCEALRQRITVYEEVQPLSRDQTSDYLRHQIEEAGASGELISGSAFTLLHDTTGGVPREINKLADEALRRAAREQSTAVTLDHVQSAARTVLGRKAETSS